MNLRRLVAAAAVGLAGLPAVALGQLPHLDPLPWYAASDSTSRLALEIQLDRSLDKTTDWAANRVMLTVTLPAGERAAWFVRMPYVSFDTGGLGALERWPDAAGDEAPADWPGSARLDGFGQIEVGATTDLRLPLLGRSGLGLALGLPTGQNSVYPWSSTSMPMRLQLRRDVAPGGDAHLWLGGGLLMHADATGEVLGPGAFPGGWQLDAQWVLVRGHGSAWRAGATWEQREGRTSLLAAVERRFAWTREASFGVRAAREFADAADRPAQWILALVWRFDRSASQSSVSAPRP